MSDLLQIACPKCSTKMRVRRPSAEKASVTCTSCAAKFTFRVPPAAVTPQAAAPVHVDLGAFNFDSLPAQSMPTRAVAPQRYRPTTQIAGGRQGVKQKKPHKKPSAIPLGPIAIGGIALVVIGLIGTAGYFAAKKVPILARSVSIFDSVDAIAADADAADAELLQLTSSIGSAPDLSVLEKRLEELSMNSYKLVLRVVQTSTISEAKASAMQAQWQNNSETNLEPDKRKDDLIEQVKQLPQDQMAKWRFMVSHFARNQGFVRSYIRHGHLDLPTPTTEGERILFDKLTLMRKLNSRIAKLVQGMPVEKPENIQTDEQIRDYLDSLYAPIIDDVQRATEKMNDLASQRYSLEKSQLGDSKKYMEIEEHVEAARSMVLSHGIVLAQKKTKAADAFGELIRAKGELEAAGYGHMPSRLAVTAAKKQADATTFNNEPLEQTHLAQHPTERAAIQQPDELNQRATTGVPTSMDPASIPANESILNADANTSAPGATRGFGSRGFPPFRGRPGGRSAESMQDASSMAGPNFGPSRSIGTRPAPPSFNPSTSITITMPITGSVDTKDFLKKVAKLKVSAQVSITNGLFMAKVDYAGPLDDIVKLIDFAQVVSTDPATRSIILTAKN